MRCLAGLGVDGRTLAPETWLMKPPRILAPHPGRIPSKKLALRGSRVATRAALVTHFKSRRMALVLAVALAAASQAEAQTTGPVPSRPEATAPAETAPRPKPPRDKRTQINALFEALRLAPDEATAEAVGERLEPLLGETQSTAGELLLARANAAAEAKQYDLALALLDQVVEIEPDSLAGFSRRATVYYLQDDYADALLDIREVLAREPRHYTMLLGLAMILREIGDEPRALEAARKALAVNPNLAPAKELVSQLATKVDGRGI